MGLWDEEGIQMPPNDVMHLGKGDIRKVNGPVIADPSISWKSMIKTEEVLRFDSGYALGRGLYRLVGTTVGGAASTSMDGKFMSVLKKHSDGTWLSYRDCFNWNTPPRPGA